MPRHSPAPVALPCNGMLPAAGAAMPIARHHRFSRVAACRFLLAVTGFFGVTTIAAAAPSPLALSCTGCHQSSVNSPEMPSLSALPASAIEASLKSFRDMPKSGSIMARFTAKMSDADIAQLAAELGAATETKKP